MICSEHGFGGFQAFRPIVALLDLPHFGQTDQHAGRTRFRMVGKCLREFVEGLDRLFVGRGFVVILGLLCTFVRGPGG